MLMAHACCSCTGWSRATISARCSTRCRPSGAAVPAHRSSWPAMGHGAPTTSAVRRGPRVTFVGAVFHDRPAHSRAADIYLCPTSTASFGITLLEAMGCGTPALLADNAGFRSVVKGGIHALLLPSNDPAVWADAIVELAGDPGRRQAMSAAGLLRVGEYGWPVIAHRILEVYQRGCSPHTATAKCMRTPGVEPGPLAGQ